MWCFVSLFFVVSTSAIDCLERLVSEMTCYVSCRMLNPTHSCCHVECFNWLLHVLCISKEIRVQAQLFKRLILPSYAVSHFLAAFQEHVGTASLCHSSSKQLILMGKLYKGLNIYSIL